MRLLRSWRFWLLGGCLVLAGLGLSRSWLAVDETQYVLLTEFGRVVAVLGPEQAGFHWKRPWRTALAIDRRLRVFDPPARESLTGDKRNLEVSPYVVWRVADPERYVRAAGSREAVEARLSERIASALSAAIGRRELSALASTENAQWQLDALMAEVLDEVARPAREELGVEVVDVRLRRFNHPLEVRPAVFDLIRSERRQVAATLRAEGEAAYQEITSRADRERDALLAEADADAERIRGRADAEATRILNEAHAQDPKFYEFVRTLETYKALLDDKATVILSSASPLLRVLTQGPPPEVLTPGDTTAASPAAVSRATGEPAISGETRP